MMFEDMVGQAIRSNEIFFFEHCAGALEQTRFMPAAVKFGAVSPKNNNQQQDGRSRGDIECNSHGRQMKAQTRKRFDARQRTATSLTSNASDSFRHLIFYARGVVECNWHLTRGPGRNAQVCSASLTTGTLATCARTRSRTPGPQTYRVRRTFIVAVNGTARIGPSKPPINNPQTKMETMTVIGCSPTDFSTIRGA